MSLFGIYNTFMRTIFEQFDAFLCRRGLRFEGVVIGGAALTAGGIVQRATRDVDCLAPPVPEAVKEAARAFVRDRPETGLDAEWLNNGPADLAEDLPRGWRERTIPLFEGTALRLRTLGRLDLLRTKLFAYCDRQQDFNDCVALAPTAGELAECRPWVEARDGHPGWPGHVAISFRALQERMGHDLPHDG